MKEFVNAVQEAKKMNILTYFANPEFDFSAATFGKLFGTQNRNEDTIGIFSKEGLVFKKYVMTNEITTENIKKFLSDFKARSLERYYMSAPEPKQHKYVRELVGSSFYDTIKKGNTNALVMFYFPWCEECTKLEPTWNSLGYRLRNADDVIIGKVDISENDVKNIDIGECPTIIFYPSGQRPYEVYAGSRNIKSFTDYLKNKIDHLKSNDDL